MVIRRLATLTVLAALIVTVSPAGLSAEEPSDWGTGNYKGFGVRPDCTAAGSVYGTVSGVMDHDDHLLAISYGTVGVEVHLALTPTSCAEGTAQLTFFGEGDGLAVGPRGGVWTVGVMTGTGRYVSDGTSTTVVLDDSSWAFCRGPRLLCGPAHAETLCEDPTLACEYGGGPMEFDFSWSGYSEEENSWQVDGAWTLGSPPITVPSL